MSAGICIMNQYAVALAADSAMRINKGEAFHNSGNKLFSLSKNEPVGALIYATTNFMRVPIELILKQYRKYIDSREECLAYLEDYVNDFFKFLLENKKLFRFELNEENFILLSTNVLLDELDLAVDKMRKQYAKTKGFALSDEESKSIYKKAIEGTIVYINNLPYLENFNVSVYVEMYYRTKIYSIIRQRYGGAEEALLIALTKCAIEAVSKDFWGDKYVGLAVVGYGKEDIYPSMVEIHLAGFVHDNLKYKVIRKSKIDESGKQAIIPLAQFNVMETFLYGLNSDFLYYIKDMIPKTISEDIDNISDDLFIKDGKSIVKKELETCAEHILDNIIKEAHSSYFEPIVRSISVLPIEELVWLAESMINLTSLKRQVVIDADSRTVGGPVDVAVLSKSDGFIWIKQKQYFDTELNPQYFYKNFGRR